MNGHRECAALLSIIAVASRCDFQQILCTQKDAFCGDLGEAWEEIGTLPATRDYGTRHTRARGWIVTLTHPETEFVVEIVLREGKSTIVTAYHECRDTLFSMVHHSSSHLMNTITAATHGIIQMLKKPSTPSAEGNPAAQAAICHWATQHPTIFDYLTQEVWPDGSKRTTSTISISFQEGRFLITVRDRALTRVCFHSGTTLTEALLLADAGLESEETVWRKDTWNKQSKK